MWDTDVSVQWRGGCSLYFDRHWMRASSPVFIYFIFNLNRSRALGIRTRRRPSPAGDGSEGMGGMGGNDGSSLACRLIPPDLELGNGWYGGGSEALRDVLLLNNALKPPPFSFSFSLRRAAC